jgi:hypothetical protein
MILRQTATQIVEVFRCYVLSAASVAIFNRSGSHPPRAICVAASFDSYRPSSLDAARTLSGLVDLVRSRVELRVELIRLRR